MCTIPDILYKYKVISEDDHNNGENAFTRRLLEKGELYFSQFSELNDPNEAIFGYSASTIISPTPTELQNPIYRDFLNTRQNMHGKILLTVDGWTATLHVRNRINNRHGVFMFN